MLVKIEEIQDKGLRREEPVAPKVLDATLKDSEGYSHVSATPLAVYFHKVSGRVHVEGGFVETVKAPCKRCLKDVEREFPVDFKLRMIPEAELEPEDDDEDQKPTRRHRQKAEDDGQGPESASFDLDQIDAEPFDGKTIDLDPIVREQVLLALPVAVLCRDDCKGLCAECGQDLNEKDCGHGGKKDIDVRLLKLKDIKLKS
jgi:uncharacterized protein